MDRNYNVNIGYRGTFKNSGNVSSSSHDVDRVFEKLQEEGRDKIALSWHGGLVSESSGIDSAKIMNREILSAGVYPISFIWETGFGETINERTKGLLETVIDEIKGVNKTKIFRKVLKYSLKKVGSKLNLSIDAKGFDQLSDQEIENELKSERPFEDFIQKDGSRSELITAISEEEYFFNELEAELFEDFEADQEFQDLLTDIDLKESKLDESYIESKSSDGEKGLVSFAKFIGAIAKITFRVIKRFVIKRDHGIYPTILEEILRELYISKIGAWIWTGMKDKAEEMWNSNLGLSGDKLHVGTYFLTKLNEFALGKDLRIDLIGHSAGSIVICNMLKHIESLYLNIKINKIIFLAPACRSELFDSEIVKKQSRFRSIRIFTMKDEAESKDALVNNIPKLYPRSLLYFISGVLEENGKGFDEHILGMERFISDRYSYNNVPHLNRIKEFLSNKNRLVLTPSLGNEPGMNSDAIDHGDFNENDETLKSIKELLK